VNKALLDTDIYSEVLKAIDPIVARNAAAYRRIHGTFTVSVITVTEIVQGLQRVQSARRIQTFRNAISFEQILLFDQAAADLAGRIAGDLTRTGQTIGDYDPLIAAVAITQGLDLVTGNTAHFQRLPPLGYPLTLVNWRV
jgi:tRNA(fMet)-specific endonuclease VapC